MLSTPPEKKLNAPPESASAGALAALMRTVVRAGFQVWKISCRRDMFRSSLGDTVSGASTSRSSPRTIAGSSAAARKGSAERLTG